MDTRLRLHEEFDLTFYSKFFCDAKKLGDQRNFAAKKILIYGAGTIFTSLV